MFIQVKRYWKWKLFHRYFKYKNLHKYHQISWNTFKRFLLNFLGNFLIFFNLTYFWLLDSFIMHLIPLKTFYWKVRWKKVHFVTLSDKIKYSKKNSVSCQYNNITDFQMNKVIELSSKVLCRCNSKNSSCMK